MKTVSLIFVILGGLAPLTLFLGKPRLASKQHLGRWIAGVIVVWTTIAIAASIHMEYGELPGEDYDVAAGFVANGRIIGVFYVTPFALLQLLFNHFRNRRSKS